MRHSSNRTILMRLARKGCLSSLAKAKHYRKNGDVLAEQFFTLEARNRREALDYLYRQKRPLSEDSAED